MNKWYCRHFGWWMMGPKSQWVSVYFFLFFKKIEKVKIRYCVIRKERKKQDWMNKWLTILYGTCNSNGPVIGNLSIPAHRRDNEIYSQLSRVLWSN